MNEQPHNGVVGPGRLRAFLAGMLFGKLVGLLLGSLVGAGAMLLLMPRTGKPTRTKTAKHAEKLRFPVPEGMDDLVADSSAPS